MPWHAQRAKRRALSCEAVARPSYVDASDARLQCDYPRRSKALSVTARNRESLWGNADSLVAGIRWAERQRFLRIAAGRVSPVIDVHGVAVAVYSYDRRRLNVVERRVLFSDGKRP